jgi:Cu2+-exporting ATPase
LKDGKLKSTETFVHAEAVAKHTKKELKMDGFFAGVLRDQKLDKIKELQSKSELLP